MPEDDTRVRPTIERVHLDLATGPFVRRYRTEEMDDGVGDDEGAFYILGFWLIDALLVIGKTDEAIAGFHQLASTTSHLRLFAEMIDLATHTALGNFPQAFSHIGFIHTARNVSAALRATGVHPELFGWPPASAAQRLTSFARRPRWPTDAHAWRGPARSLRVRRAQHSYPTGARANGAPR